MKTLLGASYEQLVAKLGVRPTRHYYAAGGLEDFSVFVEGNEFLFEGGELFSVEISNFDSARRIPGFALPIPSGLEDLIRQISDINVPWEVFSKYSRDHWVVIRLPNQNVLYEFEFEESQFLLRFIRLEGGDDGAKVE